MSGIDSTVFDVLDRKIRRAVETHLRRISIWVECKKVFDNTYGNNRIGNLMRRDITTLSNKMFAQEPEVKLDAFNPDGRNTATILTDATREILSVSGAREEIRKAFISSVWATYGWLEINHPNSPVNHDPVIMLGEVNAESVKPDPIREQWKEADRELLNGLDLSQVEQIDFDPTKSAVDDIKPLTSLVSAPNGYPYVRSVDPRLIMLPERCDDVDSAEFVCRLRVLSNSEIRSVYKVDERVNGDFMGLRDIICDVEGVAQEDRLEMAIVIEVYIRKSRVHPQLRDRIIIYTPGNANVRYVDMPNPHGKMLPFVPYKFNDSDTYNTASFVYSTIIFTDAFHDAIIAMRKRMGDSRVEKTLVSPNAFASDEDRQRFEDSNYDGIVEVRDANGVKPYSSGSLDPTFLAALNFLYSTGGSQINTTDADRGTAVKGITAEQSRAIMAAAAMNLEGMRGGYTRSVKEVTLKLLYLMGIYNESDNILSSITGRAISVSWGNIDIGRSYTFTVSVVDQRSSDNEERMTLMQLLSRVGDPSIAPMVNMRYVVSHMFRVFGFDPKEAMKTGVDPAQLPPEDGTNTLDKREHPEREAGSRGLTQSIANQMSGAMRAN